MTEQERQETNSPGHSEKDHHVKSAWEVAQERAERLLSRSDDELEQEDAMRRQQDAQGQNEQQTNEQLSEEQKDYLDLLRRQQAEFANYRKRVEREKEEFVKYATGNLIAELTDVLDAFERGLHEDHAQEVPDAYRQGIEGVYRKFNDVLGRYGLKKIETVGQPFNPEIHEAAMQEPTDEFEPGTICGEIRPGYMLGERLLRAPLVKVATAPQE